MNVLFRCVVLALGAFGVAYVVTSLGVALRWARHRAHRPGGTASNRADALLRLRLLPGAWALGVLVFAAVGLYRFESRDSDEVLGRILVVAGAFGASLLLIGAARIVGMQWKTARLVDAWMAGATPITFPDITIPAFTINTGYPVVAVVGVLRPRLVIDVRVLRACSGDEVRAILAHERGHMRRWDNLRRLLFAAAPGPVGAPGLAEAWGEATEEAADDFAAAGGADTRFHLATALLRVSRLAPAAGDTAGWQRQLPASALYRGEGIEHRVRRLVDVPASHGGHRRSLTPLMALIATVVLGAAFALQRDLHDAMEVAVAILP